MYQKYVALREKNMTTDYKVAKGAKVTKSTFTDWKTGRSVPKLDKLQAIANYFNVPITYFLEEQEEKANA